MLFVRRVDEDHLIIFLVGTYVADQTNMRTKSSCTVGAGDGGRGWAPIYLRICFYPLRSSLTLFFVFTYSNVYHAIRVHSLDIHVNTLQCYFCSFSSWTEFGMSLYCICFIQAPTSAKANEEFQVELSFSNPLPVALTQCTFTLEGAPFQPVTVKHK